jgi:nucleoid-associated protein YgaU
MKKRREADTALTMRKASLFLVCAAVLWGGCARGPVEPRGAELRALELEKVEPVIPKPPPPRRAEALTVEAARTYVVRRGDTLWHIAKKFYGDGKKYTLITRANNIIDPASLKIGQKLIIP